MKKLPSLSAPLVVTAIRESGSHKPVSGLQDWRSQAEGSKQVLDIKPKKATDLFQLDHCALNSSGGPVGRDLGVGGELQCFNGGGIWVMLQLLEEGKNKSGDLG